jgi:HSP20 family molecular chaperone IbpA
VGTYNKGASYGACGSFYRIVELSEEVKADAVQASTKHGVVEVVFLKRTPKQKKVVIK